MEAAIFLGLATIIGISAGLFDFSEDEPEPPVADDDTASTTEDTPVSIDVLANDSDPDDDALSVTSASALNGSVVIEADDRLSYTPNPDFSGTDWIRYGVEDGDGDSDDAVVTVNVTAANDLPIANDDSTSTVEDTLVTINVLGNDSDVDGDPLTVTSASATNGSVTIGAGGSLTYTPNADFSGTDTISYTISDGAGGTASASVAVIVAAVNDAPVAVDDTATTAEDTPVTVDVLGNDTDVDGDTLAVTTASATNGTVVVEADGGLTYTPNADFTGSDTITYEVSDGAGGTASGSVAVTVGAANDAPVAVDDTATTAEDTPVTVDVLGNDTDVDGDTLAVTTASATNGTVVVEADGGLTYTPNADFSGTDTITYEVSDGAGGTASGSVAVTVGAANDAPVAVDDTATTAEDTPVTVDVLGNDTDVDGDTLAVTTASATNGTVVVEADGGLTYTPNADFTGSDTITYEVSDGAGGTASGSVAVTVGAANDAPVAVDDTATTAEDTPVTVDVLGNDTDVDGDTLAVTTASATNGTVVVEADGGLTYTPNADFTGSDTITYEVSDGAGGTASGSVAVTVGAANDAPVAVDDTATTAEDTPVTVDVLGNDTDVDGDTLAVTTASATNGTVVVEADGGLTYTPNADFTGSDTITYEVSDGAGGTASGSVAVTVGAANDAPVAVDDTATTAEDTPVTVDVLGNDTDVDGDTLAVTTASATNGTVVVEADGGLTYTPNADFTGSDTITYEVSDGAGGTASGSVAVTVGAANDAPVAVDDTATTAEDTPVTVDVLGNDTDVDGDTLAVTTASATNGTVVVEADGGLTYTPNADFTGSDTITYEVSDGAGGTASGSVAVTVGAANDAPVAVDDTATTAEDTPVTVDVLGNDTDVDGDTLAVTTASATNGTVVVEADGGLTYTPNADFTGSDTITYEVSDGAGGTASGSVAVTVGAANDAPVAVDDTATTAEDTPVTVDVLGNDTDVDGDTLAVTTASATNGTVVVEADGGLTYTPNADFTGSDTITYEVSDGAGGTASGSVAVTVGAANDAPVAVDDTATTAEDTPVTVDVLGNDTDVDGDTLAVTTASATNGTVVVEADGGLTYTPNADFTGSDTITYEVSDGAGGTASGSVAVTVGAANDAPVAVDDTATTAEDTPVTVDVLGNDTDVDGDTLAVTTASATNGTVVVEADGGLTYTPNADFTGSDTITYEVSDGAGGTASGSVAVTVGAANDAPVAVDDTATTAEDTPVTVDVLGNDTDVDGDTLAVTTASATNGTVVVEADGGLTYTPNADFTGSDTITYEVSDGAGGTASGSVAVTVGAANDAPVAVDDTATTAEDTPVTVDVLGNDTDVDGDTLAVTTASATNGTVVVEADGGLTYTPNADFTGSDTITYEVSDGAGGTASGSVAVSVLAAPVAPAARLSIDSGSENELFPGSEGDDEISGEDGADTISGQAGSDTLNGNAGDDEINGIWDGSDDAQIEMRDLADPDSLLGGDGNDDIFMGSGDTATGEDGRDTFYTGTWVDPDNAPVVLDLASDEVLVVSVPEGTSAGTSITLETDPLTGDTLVQANLQTVAVIAAGVGPVTADQILLVENPNFA